MYDSSAGRRWAGEGPACNLPSKLESFISQLSVPGSSDSALDENGNTYPPSLEVGVKQPHTLDFGLPELSTDLTHYLSHDRGFPEFPEVASPVTSAHASAHASSYANTSLLSTIPLSSSAAYLEPNFSCRLVRLLWEHAFRVLTHPSTPPSQLQRCFGFCLRSRSKDTLIRKFKAYLGLSNSPISELDRQTWNAAPDVRDEMNGGSDERGVWIEAGKVERYLESLGFDLTDNRDEALCRKNLAIPQGRSPGDFGERALRGSRSWRMKDDNFSRHLKFPTDRSGSPSPALRRLSLTTIGISGSQSHGS